jgi:hypothetical protein
MNVVTVDIDELNAAEWNPQVHDDENLERIKRSIREFGVVAPVIARASDNLVIGGHGRLQALRELLDEGYELETGTEVPVVFGDWTDEQVRALNVALNKIQSIADPAKLREVLSALDENWSVERATVTGFSRDDIKNAHKLRSWQEMKNPVDWGDPKPDDNDEDNGDSGPDDGLVDFTPQVDELIQTMYRHSKRQLEEAEGRELTDDEAWAMIIDCSELEERLFEGDAN